MLPDARDVASSPNLAILLKGIVPPILEDKMLHDVSTKREGNTLFINAKVDPLWIELAEITIEELSKGIAEVLQKMVSSRGGHLRGEKVQLTLVESKQDILGTLVIGPR